MIEYKLRVAIYDENLQDLKRLDSILNEFQNERFYIEIMAKKYNSIDSLIKKIKDKEEFDVVFLGLKGSDEENIQICKLIRQFTKASIIVIAEKSNELALTAFELEVSNFVVKPISRSVIFAIVNRILDTMNVKRAKVVLLNSTEGLVKIPYYKILFVDTKNHMVFYHLIDKRVIRSKTIRESFDSYITPILEDERFLRCHYSFVVNMSYVKNITGKEVKLYNGEAIPISKSKTNEIKKKSKNYLD